LAPKKKLRTDVCSSLIYYMLAQNLSKKLGGECVAIIRMEKLLEP
jgi:2-oxoglutarate dehydrogenase complex dehydrogenase (E1) component-like enzyme